MKIPFSRNLSFLPKIVFIFLLFIGAFINVKPVHAAAGLPTSDHVVVVMEENRSYEDIIGSTSAPYINSLASQGALMTNTFANTHPSQPNYLDLFAGSDLGHTQDECPLSFQGVPNIASELISKGYAFASYSENLPSNPLTCLDNNTGYTTYINVSPYFDNVPLSTNKDFKDFPTDFSQLPKVSFVIPDLYNDMHSGTIDQADTWLSQHMDAYAQWAKTHNSVLIIHWDEDDYGSANHIPLIIYGANIKPGQYGEFNNHFNLLRTLEDMYNLSYAGQSANVDPISDIWATSPTSIVIDNVTGSDTGFTQTGTWTFSTGQTGWYGANYQYDDGKGDGADTATWTPKIPTAGSYDVSINYITYANRATNVPVTIVDANGSHSKTINEQIGGNGMFLDLGTYTFNAGTSGYVQMSNIGTNGYVIADAVKFQPMSELPTPSPTPSQTPTPTPSPTPVPSGLIGYWKMDEASWNGITGEVADSSGNNLNGTAQNGAVISIGKYGNAGSFDGVNDDVSIPSATGSSLKQQFNSLSLAAWVYPTTFNSGSYGPTIISNTDNNTGLAMRVNNGYLEVDFRLSSGIVLKSFTSKQLTLNTWNHVAITYDGTNIIGYLNGESLGSFAGSGYITNSGNTATCTMIGNEPLGCALQSGDIFPFTGKIDEVRVYNRALSANEAMQLYQQTP